MFDCGINEIVGEVVSSIETEKEKLILKAVQSVGVDVDKKQLEKALFNAKSFYDDGYKDAKKKYECRWIPVNEKLPEERIAVLVWCPERKNIYCACYEGKHWWIFGAYFKKIELEVIAWMPLPEAYKESD